MTDIHVSPITRSRSVRGAMFPLRELALWLMRREKRVRDARHLRDLPDYLLQDIGLNRTEIAPTLRSQVSRRCDCDWMR